MRVLLLLVVFCSSWTWADYPVVPDEQMTPGDLCTTRDRDFSGYRYREKIPYCSRSVGKGLKRRIYEQYHIPSYCRHRYTVDHFYPLSMGGNNSQRNLWPEHKLVKALRMDLEQDVFDDLREGRLKQEEALSIIYEAKMHPPIEEISRIIERHGDDCDRAALEFYKRF